MTLRPMLGFAILLGLSQSRLSAADVSANAPEKPRVPFAHTSAVGAVAFSPDGLYVVTGADDGVIRVWSRETGTEARQLSGHRGRVSSLSFAPDGRLLASGSGDQTVGIWDFPTGKLLHRCPGHDGWVRSVQFSPDGKTVASGSFDETVRLWDPVTGKELRRFEGATAPVSAVSFTPDGKSLAASDYEGCGRLWDVATGKPVRVIPKQRRGELTGIALCDGGRLVATVSSHGNLFLWSTTTGELQQFLRAENSILSLSASPDGKLLAAGMSEGEIHLYEATSRQSVLMFPGYGREWNPSNFVPTTGIATAIHALAFSPDGAWIGAGTKDGRLRLWRIRDLVQGADKLAKPRPQELDNLWNDLAAPEPNTGFRALVRLVSAPELALPFLKPHLTPTPRADTVRIRKLLAELDDDDFTIRERATEQLAKLGETLRSTLQEVRREGKLSAEAASRVRKLLEWLDGKDTAPEALRTARVLQALEWIGTPQAQSHLAELAKGQAGSRLTEEAVQALARLNRRSRR